MKRNPILIGWSQIDITPSQPVWVFGQLYTRRSAYVHDPLSATALALETNDAQLVLLSADLAGFTPALVAEVRRRLRGNAAGLDPVKVSCSAIHTHNSVEFTQGGSVFQLLFGKDYIPAQLQPPLEKPEGLLEGAAGMEFLAARLAQVVLEAWDARKPGAIGWGQDYAVVGHNRRPTFARADGLETRMYGDCSEASFMGLEGPSDHAADFLFTWDAERRLTGIVADIPCPSQVYELHCFLSADYWADAREALRERFGQIHVLSLCGFSGDQNPLDLLRISKYNHETLRKWNAQASEVLRNVDLKQECEGIGQRIAAAAGRAYRKARQEICATPQLQHTVLQTALPVRRVAAEDYAHAQSAIAAHIRRFTPEHPMTIADVVEVFEICGVLARWEQQLVSAEYQCEIHVMRLGKVAMATCPFEPFVDFAMRIRAQSPAQQILLVQLANGNFGYIPTQKAVCGGGYSGKPASTPLGPEGGDLLVAVVLDALKHMFATE